MERALNNYDGRKVDREDNSKNMEGFLCSEFIPHEIKGERSLKAEEEIFCDELLDNSRFRKDLDDFILN